MRHLLVLQNGLHGTAADFERFEEALQRAFGQQQHSDDDAGSSASSVLEVVNSDVNHGLATCEGLHTMATRLMKRVADHVSTHIPTSVAKIHLSVVGHSVLVPSASCSPLLSACRARQCCVPMWDY